MATMIFPDGLQYGDVVPTGVKRVKKGYRHLLLHLGSVLCSRLMSLRKDKVGFPSAGRAGDYLASDWVAGILKAGLFTGKKAGEDVFLVPLNLPFTVVSRVHFPDIS